MSRKGREANKIFSTTESNQMMNNIQIKNKIKFYENKNTRLSENFSI